MTDGGGAGPSGSKQSPSSKSQLDAEEGHARTHPDVSDEEVAQSEEVAVKSEEAPEAPEAPEVPLTLVDLPIDVLRLIIDQVTEGNDLIALARTHSKLFELAMSSLYSYFNIYWSAVAPGNQDLVYVDALSHGLATLARPGRFALSVMTSRRIPPGQPQGLARYLADHNYASYVRKFQINNAPPEITSEYLTTKESGVMMGTLAAMAVGRMVNLEEFAWDMGSGILPEVFIALARLGETERPKLQQAWIRMHSKSNPSTSRSSASSSPALDASIFQPQPAEGSPIPKLSTAIGNHVPADAKTAAPEPKGYADVTFTYPTFSVMPPLKRLAALNIDDLAYLDELSILIERSAPQLVELRIGLSEAAAREDYALPWDGPDLQQVDHEANWPGENRISNYRLGGVLGVLVGRVYDIRSNMEGEDTDAAAATGASGEPTKTDETSQPDKAGSSETPDTTLERKRLDGKLKLEKLALEKVGISPGVMLRALDWTNLTSLTILDCAFHRDLWRTLKKHFQPISPAHDYDSPRGASPKYRLALKHLHVEPASLAFINFVKETIAPNTIETLFLQHRQGKGKPLVPVHQLFNGLIKGHRASIQRLLIQAIPDRHYNHCQKKWAVKRENLAYILSGNLRNLTELGMIVRRKDWRRLRWQLPRLTKLQCLYVPYIVDAHFTGSGGERELALLVADTVTLRREMQLTCVGIVEKCYEIYEGNPGEEEDDIVQVDNSTATTESDSSGDEAAGGSQAFMLSAVDIDEETLDELVDDLVDGGQLQAGFQKESATWLKRSHPLLLREISYRDRKSAMFRARNARL
ncbi:hypothetical protein F5Y17DRAFT_154582 [Xylariaceae sp. FL0594]|nr:hypothetical protein F5Y17DRAFT_154582 [Xylariaceae sp. FL0594]